VVDCWEQLQRFTRRFRRRAAKSSSEHSFPKPASTHIRSLFVRDADGSKANVASTVSVGNGGSVTVRAEGRPAVEVRYSFKTDADRPTVTSRFANETKSAMGVPLFDDLRIDSRNEDIVFDGAPT
jgi:hypothetical protein